MTTTYTESKDRAPFDWRDFLKRAQAGEITLKEIKEAEDLASEWITCACGVQYHAIPRDDGGQPIDNSLANNGADFYGCILNSAWSQASTTLDRIEKRSAEILATL